MRCNSYYANDCWLTVCSASTLVSGPDRSNAEWTKAAKTILTGKRNHDESAGFDSRFAARASWDSEMIYEPLGHGIRGIFELHSWFKDSRKVKWNAFADRQFAIALWERTITQRQTHHSHSHSSPARLPRVGKDHDPPERRLSTRSSGRCQGSVELCSVVHEYIKEWWSLRGVDDLYVVPRSPTRRDRIALVLTILGLVLLLLWLHPLSVITSFNDDKVISMIPQSPPRGNDNLGIEHLVEIWTL